MKQYLDLLQNILDNGVHKGDRTKTGMIELFGPQFSFNLAEGFPLVTTKKMFLKGIIYELIWFLMGDTNIKYLNDNGVKIWNEWANSDGDLGPVYGANWRSWPIHYGGDGTDYQVIDQIANVVEEIKTNPNSRRMITTAWNPATVDNAALPPCHCLFQFNVQNGKLNCKLYQRSADFFLGAPFNISSYALLTMMVAQVCDLEPGMFVHTFGSAHIYQNHLDQVNLQLSRTPHALPTMKINPNVKDIDGFKYEDFELIDYKHDAGIKAPIAV